MNNQKKKKYRWILMSVLILIVLVAATTIVLAERMTGYYQDDAGAIEINGPVQQETDSASGTIPETTAVDSKVAEFNVEDTDGKWKTETNVDIFRASYENGEGKVTVLSNDGEKVIAPGTDNQYTFKLKNTGDVPLDYIVDVRFIVTTDSDMKIPVEARINRYDGTWILGGKQTFIDVLDIDDIRDQSTLGSGRYTYYTLEWQWPFEQGRDDLDTMLGSMTAEQELTITVQIKTTAWTDADLDDKAGIISPQTGDDMNTSLWIAIAVCMVLMMLLLFFTRKREDEEAEEK